MKYNNGIRSWKIILQIKNKVLKNWTKYHQLHIFQVKVLITLIFGIYLPKLETY